MSGCAGVLACGYSKLSTLIALRANAFHYKGDRMRKKAFGHFYRWNSHIFKAVGLLALFTIEVQMSVRMMVVSVMMA